MNEQERRMNRRKECAGFIRMYKKKGRSYGMYDFID
jgi:hypothetical protein